MAWSFDGVNDTGVITPSGVSGSSLIAISFWLYWNSYANDDDLAMEYCPDINSNNGGFYINPNGSYWGGGGKVEFAIGSGANLDISTITRPSAATWHHWLVNFNVSSSGGIASVYIDGSAVTVTSQLSSFGSTLNAHNLYIMHRGAGSLYGAGRICEIALWPGKNLTASEALAAMYDCGHVCVDSLKMYLPFWGDLSPEPNLKGSNSCTISGAVKTNHAPVALFSRRFGRSHLESAESGVSVAVATQAAAFSLPTPTVTGEAIVQPPALSVVFSQPTATITGAAIIPVNTAAALFSTPTASIIGQAIVAAGAQTAVWSSPSATITGGATVSFGPATAQLSPLFITVDTSSGITVSVGAAISSFSVPSPSIFGSADPQSVVNLIYGRPLEIRREITFKPPKETWLLLDRELVIEVTEMSLTIPLVSKSTSDNLTYTFDFRNISFLGNDPITGTPSVSQLSGSGSLTFTTPERSGKIVTVGIGGGTAGQVYRVGLLATTINGRVIDALVDIRVVSRTSSG